MSSIIIRGTVVEDSSAIILARVPAADGTLLEAADIASLTYSVKSIDADGVATVVAGHDAVALTPASIVTAEVASIEDSRWPYSSGYNFRHDIAYTAFPSSGVQYRYEARVIETGGARYFVRAQLSCDGVFSS